MLKYLKKYWVYALLAPLFMIGEVIGDLLQPQLMSVIVDEGVLGISNGGVGNMQVILSAGLKMVLLLLFGGTFGVLSGVFANLCSQSFGNDVRKDCFKKIMSLSFQQTDRFSTGSLVTRVTNDVTQVQNFVMQCIRMFVRTFMLFGGGIVCMISLDLSFGAVIGCSLPVVAVIIIFFIRKASPIFSVLQQKLDRVNSVVQENVAGARTVKAYVREDYEKNRFGQANDDLVNTQLSVLKLFSYMMPLMNIIMNLVTVAILYTGAVRIQAPDSGLTPGNIMAAITYVSQIMFGIFALAMIFQSISRGTASARRLREVLDCEPAILDGGKTPEGAPKGEIEFRDVSFAYPNGSGEKVLEHVNLTIHPGETLGILGATGSGKTSLVGLIPRFYDVSEGAVLLDGVDVRDYPLHELRARIAIALQKSELFNMSIAENIHWGRDDAQRPEIEQAAATAQAAGFIAGQPEGYETAVSEMGASLSGGQKQRVAISRAVLKNAPVMIFDDATSALDLKTEAQLYAALGERSQSATKIIIAQRIASVRRADRIAVIDNGRIAACDSHEELMKSCAIYQDIYNSQLKRGDEPNA